MFRKKTLSYTKKLVLKQTTQKMSKIVKKGQYRDFETRFQGN